MNVGDPKVVVIDTPPAALGFRVRTARIRRAHIPGAFFANRRGRLGRRQNRHERPPSAARPKRSRASCVARRERRDADRRLRRRRRHVRSAPLDSCRWIGHDAVAVLDGGIERVERARESGDDAPTGTPRRRHARRCACVPKCWSTPQYVLAHPENPAMSICSTRARGIASPDATKRWIRSPATFPARRTVGSNATHDAEGS